MTDHAGNSPEEPTPVDPVAEEWSDKIRPFLDSNPEARVRIRDDDIHVERPWGDSSLILELTDDLVDDLNGLRLFPEFSAVYHLDTGRSRVHLGTRARVLALSTPTIHF